MSNIKTITIDNQEIKVEVKTLENRGNYNSGHSSLERYTPIIGNIRWDNFAVEQWESADYTQSKTLEYRICENNNKVYNKIVKAIKTHYALNRLGALECENLRLASSCFVLRKPIPGTGEYVWLGTYVVANICEKDLLASNLSSLATRIKEGIPKAEKEWQEDLEQRQPDNEARELAKLETQRLLEEQKLREQEELDALDKVGV